MFETLENTFIDLKNLNLVHLYQSLNQPHISPAKGKGAQASHAYLMVLQSDPHSMMIYIGLFFPEESHRVLYGAKPFAPEELVGRLAAAESFVAEMGFLMDNTHLSKASAEERAEILRTVPFFYKQLALYYDALSTSEIETKKALQQGHTSRDQQADLQRAFWERYVQLLSML